MGFRPGVHKSESAKEMLLSQPVLGPLPPSPPTSSPEHGDDFPPLPPSPIHHHPTMTEDDETTEDYRDMLHNFSDIRIRGGRHKPPPPLLASRTIDGGLINGGDHHPSAPAVPPHRHPPSLNTLKTRSMDAGFSKSYRNPTFNASGGLAHHHPGTLPPELPGSNSRRRLMSGAFPKRAAQSPREERRLQTSCSLPETPIFARG